MVTGVPPRSVAIVHGVPVGDGGLAVQTANVIAALARPGVEAHALGPGLRHWPRTGDAPTVTWHSLVPRSRAWTRLRVLRSFRGRAQQAHDTRLARQAAEHLDAIRPALVYAFTLVALESLLWARARSVPSVLESPNGHIRDFREIYQREQHELCGGPYLGHPTAAMVRRVEEEYRLADRIRVSSQWARDSLIAGGVAAGKIDVLQQPVDLVKYHPCTKAVTDGPLKIVAVGTLDLRKGFVYLLDAVRRAATDVALELVGGTVDRCTRRLLRSRSTGLAVQAWAGDPRPAYARADLAVLATLEDGSPFAVAEAMASGLPVIVTDCCGAREWVHAGRSGWIVPGRDAGALAAALTEAARQRPHLPAMGAAARAAAEQRADPATCDRALAEWAFSPSA